jgi:hypothetical protein
MISQVGRGSGQGGEGVCVGGGIGGEGGGGEVVIGGTQLDQTLVWKIITTAGTI